MQRKQEPGQGTVYDACKCPPAGDCKNATCGKDWRRDLVSCVVPGAGFSPTCEMLSDSPGLICPQQPYGIPRWDPIAKAPYVQCTYLLDKFNDWDTVQSFRRNYTGSPQLPDALNNSIYPHFCMLPAGDCPPAPGDPSGKPMPSCPNLVAPSGAAAAECRTWAAKAKVPGATPEQQASVEAAFTTYCAGKDPQAEPVCACVSRYDDPIYQAVKGMGMALNDKCWYAPCKGTSPNVLVTPSEAAQPCPSHATICQNLVDVVVNNPGTSTVSINDIRNTTNCGMPGVCLSDADCAAPQVCSQRKCVGGPGPGPPGPKWPPARMLLLVVFVVVAVFLGLSIARGAKAGRGKSGAVVIPPAVRSP